MEKACSALMGHWKSIVNACLPTCGTAGQQQGFSWVPAGNCLTVPQPARAVASPGPVNSPHQAHSHPIPRRAGTTCRAGPGGAPADRCGRPCHGLVDPASCILHLCISACRSLRRAPGPTLPNCSMTCSLSKSATSWKFFTDASVTRPLKLRQYALSCAAAAAAGSGSGSGGCQAAAEKQQEHSRLSCTRCRLAVHEAGCCCSGVCRC
jgi:hypothetical protein